MASQHPLYSISCETRCVILLKHGYFLYLQYVWNRVFWGNNFPYFVPHFHQIFYRSTKANMSKFVESSKLHDQVSHIEMVRHAMDFHLLQWLFNESLSISLTVTPLITVDSKPWTRRWWISYRNTVILLLIQRPNQIDILFSQILTAGLLVYVAYDPSENLVPKTRAYYHDTKITPEFIFANWTDPIERAACHS